MECAYHVLLCTQFLSSLAQLSLSFKILLEVIFASLEVHLQQIVELLQTEFVIVPQFVGILCRHSLYLAPFSLQSLHLLIGIASLLRSSGESFYALYYLLLALKVSQLFSLLLLEGSLSALLYYIHFSLERLLCLVRHRYILHRVAATIDVGFLCSLTVCVEQMIEGSLQVIKFSLVNFFLTVSEFLHTL